MARKFNRASLPSTNAIINWYSPGGVSSPIVNATSAANAVQVLCGTVTANTPVTLLNLTGSGEVSYLSAYALNTTSRTVRLIVTVDGTEVFDAVSDAITVTNTGMLAVGARQAGTVTQTPLLRFNSSLVVELASSLSETDLCAIAYNLYRYA